MFFVAVLATLLGTAAFAQETGQHFKFYGFIRNYFVYDSHESSAGAEDLYYYMPVNTEGNKSSFNFVTLTSRAGVDVLGYEFKDYKIGAKIEADFYLKVNSTAALRLRQAYVSIAKDKRYWKIGQAWHPMAIDIPDIFSLESGAPFGPFSRTPQLTFEYNVKDAHYLTASAIWQMQYTSTGPNGASAEYIKRGIIPEFYVGYIYRNKSTVFKAGVNILSIKPDESKRLTEVSVFEYFQKKFGDFALKEKITYATDGAHLNMVGGYGRTSSTDDYKYSATRNLSGWISLAYQKSKTWVPSILVGYIKNFGTSEDVVESWCKNNASTMNMMYRIQPEIVYNLGKLQFGLEYMLTSVQYGDSNSRMRAASNLHWVSNHRIQGLVKFTF